MRPAWLVVAGVVLAAWATLCVVVVLAVTNAHDAANTAVQNQEVIQEALTRSCQDNGNPLRQAVTQMLQDQIDQSKNTTRLHEFFPQVSQRKLNSLIRKANAQRRKEIRSIQPVGCYALYHSKGS